MRGTLLCVSLFLVVSAPASGQKRALSLEDYHRVRTVASPQISPDGARVSYTVSLRIEEGNETETRSCIVRAGGSAEPVLVRHLGEDVSDPEWAGKTGGSHQ